jgi:hypothetical protein
LRLQYVSAAFEAGQNVRALIAAKPILQDGTFYGQRFSQGNSAFENEGYYGQNKIPVLTTLKPQEANQLTWFAIHAREKRNENDEVLTLLSSALSVEQDSTRHRALETEQKRLETEAARMAENEERSPQIHDEFNQDRIVRPRILSGELFVPRKKANHEEDAE